MDELIEEKLIRLCGPKRRCPAGQGGVRGRRVKTMQWSAALA
ncbi:hypothetical protein ACFWY6_40945 [Streptomyces sp. NPDC059037]